MKKELQVNVTKNDNGTYTLSMSPAHFAMIGFAKACTQREGSSLLSDALNLSELFDRPIVPDFTNNDDGYSWAMVDTIRNAVSEIHSDAFKAFICGGHFSDNHPEITMQQVIALYEKDADALDFSEFLA